MTHKPIYNLETQRHSDGSAYIEIVNTKTVISLDNSFTSYHINFDKGILCVFREGKYDFTKNEPSHEKTLGKVYSLSGKLLHSINFPRIDKDLPEKNMISHITGHNLLMKE